MVTDRETPESEESVSSSAAGGVLSRLEMLHFPLSDHHRRGDRLPVPNFAKDTISYGAVCRIGIEQEQNQDVQRFVWGIKRTAQYQYQGVPM
jgi:hypothetical protein